VIDISIKTFTLKVDKATFAFIEAVVNVIMGVVSGLTPSNPYEVAAKVIVIGVVNAAVVYLGVESGFLPSKPEQ